MSNKQETNPKVHNRILEKIKKQSKKVKVVAPLAVAIVMLIVITLLVTNLNSIKEPLSQEIRRSMTYNQVQKGDEKVNGTDYVEFDAFFLRDLDGDGYAESIRGTCREIGSTDTLYMELRVLTNGRLENGVITINGDNFYLQTAIPKDNEIKENVIGNNVKTIKLNTIDNGRQKLLTGAICSGDYTNINKMGAIGNDISKYSKVNSVTLTGTHIAEDGTQTPITKTVEFHVDWHGETKAEMPTNLAGSKNLDQEQDLGKAINEEKETFTVEINVGMQEVNNNLVLKKAYIEGTIPELNGYAPLSVTVTGKNVTYTYNKDTREFSAQREAVTNENGIITAQAYEGTYKTVRYNRFKVLATYPLAAYLKSGEKNIDYVLPVRGYYEGYNNQNTEFTNPYKSNTVKATFIVSVSEPRGTVAIFSTTVGTYASTPTNRYIISKENPLRIYNGNSELETKDTYLVKWSGYTGTDGKSTGMVMKETKNGEEQVTDQFIKTDSSIQSMENITTNVGIYFSGATSILGEEGWIKVYDEETNELLETFTKSNWSTYNQTKPYTYRTPVKHIRIETSATNADSHLYVYNVKQLDDEYIVANYSKEEFDELQYIKSTLTGYLGEKYINTSQNSASYETPYAVVAINANKTALSTQETEKNMELTIMATADENANQVKWLNGAFLLKLPKDILDIEINSVTSSDSDVKIVSYEQYEQDGVKYLKINTENTVPTTYNIDIDCNITPDPRIVTQTESITLYAYNQNVADYLDKAEDIYDVNDNLNKKEMVAKVSTSISLVSPNSLLTNQTATNYDEKASIAVAPQISIVSKTQRSADVNIQIKNNYTSTISEVTILGRVPYEGNKYTINGSNLSSNYTATMKNTGIQLPEALKNKAVIYYSENGEATKDIANSSNSWTTTPTDFSKVKSYLISLENNTLSIGESYNFTYTIEIPEGLNYNQVAYSHHAVYFSLDTTEGKYRTQTEPNKLGFMVAKQYDLELTKYQVGKQTTVSGATYGIIEEGKEESRTGVTGINGKLSLTNLYVDKTYIIKEIKSPENYELNTNEIKFRTIEENGELKFTLISGTVKDMQVIQSQEEKEYKVQVEVEDEVKVDLDITKTEQGTNIPIQGVRFKIIGKNFENGKTLTTNTNGEMTLKGLSIDEEYTLEETKAEGYYLATTKFKIVKTNDEYQVVVLEGAAKQTAVVIEDEIPNISMNIENEKIPTYTLNIKKVKANDDEEKVLSGARYSFTSEDTGITKYYTTDIDGTVTITGLYNYVEGKYITGNYTLKELRAPEGYSLAGEEVKFKVSLNNGVLSLAIENQNNLTSVKSHTISGETVDLVLQDSPIFSITKVDSQTKKALPNAKFMIQKVDTYKNVLDYAKDIDGNYVGEKNSSNQYIVTTDENGQITTPLSGGLYKITEVEAPEGYELPASTEEREKYFNIEGFEELKIRYIEDLLEFEKQVNRGNTYIGKIVTLERDIDFNDENSYRNPNDTSYGDYNGNGTVESIKEELTNANGRGFGGIGIKNRNAFYGTFLGNDYEIRNLYMNGSQSSATTYMGLFNSIVGKVCNLGVTGEIKYEDVENRKEINIGAISVFNSGKIVNCYTKVNINVNSYYGQIAGIASNSTGGEIVNCHNEGNINVTMNETLNYMGYVAGVVARAETGGTIRGCYNTGAITVNGKNTICMGGIVGRLYTSTVEKSYNTAKIIANLTSETSKSMRVGGISGFSSNNAKISNCYNEGEIIGECIEGAKSCNAGGISGFLETNSSVENCRNSGKIDINYRTEGNVGGIVGYAASGNNRVRKCYNTAIILTNIEGKIRLGGIIGFAYTNNVTQRNIIEECYNTGNISGDCTSTDNRYVNLHIGGIIGNGGPYASIANTYNIGTITCNNKTEQGVLIGGIAGCNSENANIYNSYNAGTINASSSANVEIGGIGGRVDGKTENCYNSGTLKGSSTKWLMSGGVVGYLAENGAIQNSYYLSGSASTDVGNKKGTGSGTVKTATNMKNDSFVTLLNNNRSSITVEGVELLQWTKTSTYPTLNLNINVDTSNVITEDETITAQTAIELENSLKTYNITTEIGENLEGTRTGGTITGTPIEGANRNQVESVVHQKDAKQNIVIIPDIGYVIKEITLDGEKIKYTVNETGSATLPLLEKVTQDHHYVVIFDNTMGQLLVHHYIDGTTTKVAEDEVYTDKIGNSYTTSPKVGLEKYELKKDENGGYVIPENANGSFEENIIEVIYYYEAKLVPLTVNHYIEGTQIPVPLRDGSEAQKEKRTGNEGESYNTNALTAEELSAKYELIEVPANSTGTYEYPEVEVTYYYKIKQSPGVVVHHIDASTKEKIAKDIVIPTNETANYGDSYTTTIAEDLPVNYEFVSKTDNWEGTMVDEITEVTYEYRLKEVELVKQEITKTGTEVIQQKGEVVTYDIRYNATINSYKGRVQIIVVDSLPYAIDETKSELQGGEYNSENHTITWKELQDVDTFANGEAQINLQRSIKVVFSNIDVTTTILENKVSGKLKVYTPEKELEEVTDTAITQLDFRRNLEVRKQWNDNSNEANKRPATVRIMVKNGENVVTWKDITIANQTIEDSNIWEYTFTGLSKYNPDGSLATYSIEEREININDLKFYTSQVEQETEITESAKSTKAKIINTFTVPRETIDITVNKDWKHSVSIYQKPTRVKLQVKNGETVVAEQTVTNANKIEATDLQENQERWSYTFTNLPKYDRLGNEINYTVDETEVETGELIYYQKAINQGTKTITNNYVGPIISQRKEVSTQNGESYVVEGEKVTYTIIAENAGNTGRNVVVRDNIPEGTRFVEGSIKVNDKSTYDLGTTPNIDLSIKTAEDLANGIVVNVPAKGENTNGKVEVTFEVTVNNLEAGIYTKQFRNIATIDGMPTNETITTINKSNIVYEKTVSPEGNVKVGDEITYNIRIQNKGMAPKAVVVKDNIPEGTTFVEGSVQITASEKLNNTEEASLEQSKGGLLRESQKYSKEDLEQGISITVREQTQDILSFKVKVNKGLTNGTKIRNTAYVDDEPTETTENNVIAPEISVEKAQTVNTGKNYVIKGDEITYTIRVNNRGDLEQKVTIKDNIPEGTSFVGGSIKVNGLSTYELPNEEEETQTIDLSQKTVEDLANGIEVYVDKQSEELPAIVTLSFKVTVNDNATGDIKNKATVKKGEADQEVIEETNETKTPVITFEKKAEIVKKTTQKLAEGEVTADDEIIYIIQVRNTGSMASEEVIVKDTVIDQLKIKEVRERGTVKGEKEITWQISSILAGETREVSFVAVVKYAQEEGTLKNVASVNEKPTNELETPYKKPEIELATTIEKTGDTKVTNLETPVYYEVNYTATINHFVGKAVMRFVDTLPYAIDETKSNLSSLGTKSSIEDLEPGKYVYDAQKKTIIWEEETEEIDTYKALESKVLNKTKVLSLQYIYDNNGENLHGNLTNTVKVTTNLVEPKEPTKEDPSTQKVVKTEEKEDNHTIIAEISTKVNIHHYIYDKQKDEYTTIKVPAIEKGQVVEDEEIIGLVGENYTTRKASNVAQNFTVITETPEKYEGAMTKTPIEVIYYYQLKDETVSSEITKEAEEPKILTVDGGAINYTIDYKINIKEYIGKAKVTLVDTLPSQINEEKSELQGGKYDREAHTITWEEEIAEINTFATESDFEKTITKQISLVYEGQNKVGPIVNKVKGKIVTYYPENYPVNPETEKTVDEKEDSETVEQDYRVNKTVEKIWDDNENTKGNRPESVKVQLIANGQDKWKEETLPSVILSNDNRWSYTFTDLIKYDESGKEIIYSVEELEVNEGDLEYYENPQVMTSELTGKIMIRNSYKLTDTEIESSIEKTGTDKITNSNQEVNYHISYKANITDYIGEATVILTDILPYAIDIEKSNLSGGSYNEDTKTITWVANLGHINTTQNENNSNPVSIEGDITLVYKDLDVASKKMKNLIKGRIEFTQNDTKNEVEDEHETLIDIRGEVIVKYVDKSTGEELRYYVKPGEPGNEDGIEDITKTFGYDFEDKAGKEYETEQKEIYGYTFIEDSGNTKGNIKEGTIEVIYYYERTDAGNVIVKYVDEEGNELLPNEIIEGKVGDPYKTEAKEIENYELEGVRGDNPEGTLDKNSKEVVYYYKKIPTKIIIRHLEKETEKQLALEETIEGKAGDAYETNRKVIEGYRKAKPEPENARGKMTKETIVVTYYYEKIPSGKITVKYVDIDTKEEIAYIDEDGERKIYTYEISGYIGEVYKTSEKEIGYYVYVKELEPSNKEGVYKQDDDTVIFYYRKLPFNISVEKTLKQVAKNGKECDISKNNKITKVEVKSSEFKATEIQMKYNITVSNTGEIEGKAKIVDKVPSGLKIASTNPEYWKAEKNGYISTTVELKAKETKELEVALIWKKEENNFGSITNKVEIVDVQNPANYLETNIEDNNSEAIVVISIQTGAQQKVLVTSLGTIAASGLLILLYQYQRYQRERNKEIRHIVVEGKNVVIRKKKQK